MIVDCHHHVIQHWIGACGHESREVHAKYLQHMMLRTVAPVYRARDGARADTSALRRGNGGGWSDLADASFRVGRYGQLEFTKDGEDYYVQYMPVGMQEHVAPPELLLAQMTHAGVDHAVLHAGGLYGAMTDYNAFSQSQYPEKMTGLMWIDEAMAGSDAGLAELDRGHRLGLKGVYFNTEAFGRYDFAWAIDDARLEPFWARLNELGLILCAELGGGPDHDAAGYIGKLTRLGAILDRHRNIRCHLAMGPPVALFGTGGRWDFPDEVLKAYRHDRMWIEIMFPITWGGAWDYPYAEARPLIRQMRDLFGADRLLWGSDMPNVERFCTYRQSLDYVRRYCEFLGGAEMDKVLGLNTAALYGIAAR
jgi:predicted TIM-barrel fold metal-dependent hydrolase